MSASVRVIGRIDLAEKIREVLRSAGFDADVVTGGPMSVYGGTPPAEGVDVVVATTVFDPPLWRVAKSKYPLRPMVAVAEPRREGALRGALLRRNGPDAYVTWPATREDLASAIRRAESSASRPRPWSFADLTWGLVYGGLLTASWTGGLGPLVAGVALLFGLPSAWNRRWQAVGGVALTLLGSGGLALQIAQTFR